jgi:hypothetical protein
VTRNSILRAIPVAALLPALFALAGCHSSHIDSTIENRTGAPIQLLEVDYPSASFGAGTLASGADFHSRFQIRGSGPLTVQYILPGGHAVQIAGPTLEERQEGRLEIVLLPNAKAQFLPQLSLHP